MRRCPRWSIDTTWTKKKPEHKLFSESFKKILTNKQIDLLLIIAMMKSLVTNSSCILLPFLWKSIGCTPSYIGFALFLFVFAGSVGSFLSPYFEKLYGSKPVIYFSMWSSFPLMLLFARTYKTMPTISLIVFAFLGLTTMLAQPVTLVLAQKTLPEYKSIVAGFVNGFCWGTIALCLSFIGIIAEKFGIIEILVILTTIPILASYLVKHLKD